MVRIEKDFSTILAEAIKDFPDEVRKLLPQIIRQLNRALQCGTDSGKVIPADSIKLAKRPGKSVRPDVQI